MLVLFTVGAVRMHCVSQTPVLFKMHCYSFRKEFNSPEDCWIDSSAYLGMSSESNISSNFMTSQSLLILQKEEQFEDKGDRTGAAWV